MAFKMDFTWRRDRNDKGVVLMNTPEEPIRTFIKPNGVTLHECYVCGEFNDMEGRDYPQAYECVYCGC